MSPSFSTTLSNGVVRLGATKPANCTDPAMGFATIAGGTTHNIDLTIEELPQTIDLETLIGATLTTASMPVTTFSFYSWDSATSSAIELESRLGFLQAQGKNLVLSATGAGPITQDFIKIDNFFGCVQDVSPFLNTQNTLLLKHAAPASPLLLKLTICVCQCHQLTAVPGMLEIYMPKNKGTLALLEVAEQFAQFVLPRPGKCTSLNYFMFSGGSPISGALASKLTLSSGNIQIDTAITGATDVVEFTLRGEVNGAPINTADRAVKVYIGCHGATTLTTSVSIPPDHPYIKNSSENGERFKLLLYPTAQHSTSWDL